MQKLAAVLAAAAALVAPSLAHAGDVAMRVQDVPLGLRALSAAAPAMHFNMLAVHWTGTGTVLVRTRRLNGRWTQWAAADADVAPDGGTGAWHDGNLDWTGASDAFQFRRSGEVLRLRAYELWSRVTTRASRRLSEAGSPTIVPRSGWGANERIVRAKPSFAPIDRLAVVHHTAGTNSYTAAQAAAIVRGIEVYHVQGNGWNDIGYNFLVDRFGTVYEGRGGGVDKNVVGAHAEGFNSGTVGVALIGNFVAATPPKAMQDALVNLLAWRLDVAHVDPLSTVVYTSGGNYKFKAGKLVTLRAISGHRDTGPSECPGNDAYALLPAIAKRVSLTGLPKLYSPTVAGTLGGSIRFQGRLSSAQPWTVTIVDQLGQPVASGKGRGTLVNWTWNSLVAGKGTFTWTIAAPGVLPATGTIGVGRPVPPPPAVSLTNLAAVPVVIAPAADGTGGTATVSFNLGVQAQVSAQVQDAVGAQVLSVLDEKRSPGANSFTWDATTLPDGRYRLLVTAQAGTKSVTKTADLTVDRTLTGLAASFPVLSPNGDGVADTTTFSFNTSQNVPARLDIEQAGGLILASPFQGELPAGPHTLDWDGTANGTPLPDGKYTAVFTVTDALGDVQIPLAVTIDTHPPTLTMVDPHLLEFTLDEPATVTVLVNGKTRVVLAEPKGTFTIPFAGSVFSVSAEAQDAGGNLSPVVAA
ncbi:MAG TPA: N-acetylmuramoyl-L-alanine amidase [Gaiellaceae bacterium]